MEEPAADPQKGWTKAGEHLLLGEANGEKVYG